MKIVKIVLLCGTFKENIAHFMWKYIQTLCFMCLSKKILHICITQDNICVKRYFGIISFRLYSFHFRVGSSIFLHDSSCFILIRLFLPWLI